MLYQPLTTIASGVVKKMVKWLLVGTVALRRPWRSWRLGGLNPVSDRRFISRISCILRFKIISPMVRSQFEIIPGFLASLFNFLIGFRIPHSALSPTKN